MLNRDCPKCGKHTLKIPIVSEWFICKTCSTLFTLSSRYKWLYSIIIGVFSILIVFGILNLLRNGFVSFFDYFVIVYLVLPTVSAIVLKVFCMYFGELKGPKRLRMK